MASLLFFLFLFLFISASLHRRYFTTPIQPSTDIKMATEDILNCGSRYIDIKLVLNDAGRNEIRRQREHVLCADMAFLNRAMTTLFQLKKNWMQCQEYFVKYVDSDGDLIDFSTEEELKVGLVNILQNCPEEGPKQPLFHVYITKKGTGVQKPSEANSKKGRW